jgi:rare lipoprotein A
VRPVFPYPARLAALAVAFALPAAAQPDAPAAPPPAALDSAVVWAPAPGLVVAAADSAALVAFVAGADDLGAGTEAAGVFVGEGRASYYGERFRGRRTASGERFDPDALTAAHRTLPFGTRLRVTNLRTGRSVVVRVTDRGPFHGSRVIDLSKAAARRIGMVRSGTARVRIERL